MSHPDDDTYQPMSQGAWYSAARAEYALAYGREDTQRPWILTPLDTWERNPFYNGPPARHPEDDSHLDD